MNELTEYVPSALMGAVSGLRTFTSPAAVSRAANTGLLHPSESYLRFLSGPKASRAFTVLAVLELVADKLPFTPARTKPGPLFGRLVSGMLAGAAIASSRKLHPAIGAAWGGAAAIAASFAAQHLRHIVVGETRLPDYAVALAEDAVALGCAIAVSASVKPAIAAPILADLR